MTLLYRALIGALAVLLVGSLAVATFWPADEAKPLRSAAPAGAPVAVAGDAPVAADAAPASRNIFPKVLNH